MKPATEGCRASLGVAGPRRAIGGGDWGDSAREHGYAAPVLLGRDIPKGAEAVDGAADGREGPLEALRDLALGEARGGPGS